MANHTGSRRYDWSGYSHTAEWTSSLPKTFSLFAKRAGAIKSLDQQNALAGENVLPRVLNWFHVAMLGTGRYRCRFHQLVRVRRAAAHA
jgi:hypothetical protein